MAIDRYVVIAASLRESGANGKTTVYSAELDKTADFPPKTGAAAGWTRYVEGVLAGFVERGVEAPSFDAVINSNVPLGGGLSSSAALEVALATLLEVLSGITLTLEEKALLCQRAEHRYAGMPCGIMDQYSSVFGQQDALLRIDCQSGAVEYIPFGDGEVTVLITDSHVHHALADGGYAERRRQCESALDKLGVASWRDVGQAGVNNRRELLSTEEFRRARHVVSEIERTLMAAEAIGSSEWTRAGELMYASHASLRDDFDVSCAELDMLVEIARELGPSGGVYGARMTGGGFGGSTVSLVASNQAETIGQTLCARYEARTGIRATAFVSRPARGAHVIRG